MSLSPVKVLLLVLLTGRVHHAQEPRPATQDGTVKQDWEPVAILFSGPKVRVVDDVPAVAVQLGSANQRYPSTRRGPAHSQTGSVSSLVQMTCLMSLPSRTRSDSSTAEVAWAYCLGVRSRKACPKSVISHAPYIS